MPDENGSPVTVALIEKLLNPLLAKLSNFIPGGGIWMNTQRPEWNDANNALVGFGVSVVTLGYINRYLSFLLQEFGHCLENASFPISKELADLLEAQTAIFTEAPQGPSPASRMSLMDLLGESASAYRKTLYTTGLSGEKEALPGRRIRQYLEAAQEHVSDSLRHNRRPDGLWHSYNLLLLEGNHEEAHLKPLVVMLEGQVSILSSGVLQPEEMLTLLRALRESDLYRPDQDSYTLYPDKVLPGFLDKNRISTDAVLEIPLLRGLLDAGDESLIKPRPDGGYAFNADYHNSSDLAEVLNSQALSKAGFIVDNADREAVLDLFEHTFNHHAFTGRSGTFFAYEGLGSIYWHMVSKLVLAVQEALLTSGDDLPEAERDEWITHFRRLREGLGVEKSPEVYGAFPTDAYSHTPANAGAQQPGMTGQVKEDILIRLAELGLRIINGRITFDPVLLSNDEFLDRAEVLSVVSIDGHPEAIQLPAGTLAYTFCQVPVIYHRGASTPATRVTLSSGESRTFSDCSLTAELSNSIFRREGTVKRIEIDLL
ncbi:MAG TPA: hypothetical protein VJ960_01380 [Oceanipulchritudo sp.]|nr:hypothetical protein [Oceanipulchritudo sp.]